jgi:hypothetical protein
MWYIVGSSNLAGSGPKVWNCGTAGAGAGWWETSEPLGEGASPPPAAESGACDIGDDTAEEFSITGFSKNFKSMI